VEDSFGEQVLQGEGKLLVIELRLAGSLVMLPPPFLPYQRFWALHYLRSFLRWPFKDAGCLPAVHNAIFREWLIRRTHFRLEPVQEATKVEEDFGRGVDIHSLRSSLRDYLLRVTQKEGMLNSSESAGELEQIVDVTLRTLVERIQVPTQVADDRFIAGLLRRCVALAIWPFPRFFLVDEPQRYRWPRKQEPHPQVEPLRQWVDRRRK
jgi:hypothetical protein